jgi:hypothetical protein
VFCSPGYDFIVGYLELTERNYLEIGVFNGDSIGLLAKRYPNKKIFAVDPFIEDGHTVGLTGVNKGEDMITQEEKTKNRLSAYQNAFLNVMTSKEFLELITPEQIEIMNINSVFIDGSHWYDDVLIDMQLAVKLIGKNKGIITFDDLNKDEVMKAYDEICITYKDLITNIHIIYEDSNGLIQSTLYIN